MSSALPMDFMSRRGRREGGRVVWVWVWGWGGWRNGGGEESGYMSEW